MPCFFLFVYIFIGEKGSFSHKKWKRREKETDVKNNVCSMTKVKALRFVKTKRRALTYFITAPVFAEDTNFAYLASQPVVTFGSGTIYSAFLTANSSSLTFALIL